MVVTRTGGFPYWMSTWTTCITLPAMCHHRGAQTSQLSWEWSRHAHLVWPGDSTPVGQSGCGMLAYSLLPRWCRLRTRMDPPWPRAGTTLWSDHDAYRSTVPC